MTYVWDRFDIDVLDNHGWNTYSEKPASDGAYVKAEDAINREAVNAAKIATLEAQLKIAQEAPDRVYRLCHEWIGKKCRHCGVVYQD